MGAFAAGKHSQAICDRCGQQYDYLQLKKEWNGLLVCPECYEPKHPQLDPPYSRPDPEALQNPRPARKEPVVVFVGAPGDSAFESNGMIPVTPVSKLTMSFSQGLVSIPTYARVDTLMTVAPKGGGGGNAYYSGGVQQPTLGFSYQTVRGIAFADDSSKTHPMLLSTTSDGTHGGGSTYTTNVMYLLGDAPNQTFVSQSAYIAEFSASSPQRRTLAIFLDSSTPSVLYYYCQNHSGMGGQINIST
tara:strand:- start:13563 stop:14297 length:735 start_codon:yes stop_codon:yes gene_type:complete